MKKCIKNLLAIAVILVISLCCFTACDFVEDVLDEIFGGGNGDVFGDECAHEFEEIGNNANCMNGGDLILSCKKCGYQTFTYVGPTEHIAVVIPAVEGDCYNAGWTEGSHCEYCGKTLSEPQMIEYGHQFEVIEEIEATCTTDGRTRGEICTVCGYEYQYSSVIPASHDFVYYYGVEATCTENGYMSGEKCIDCGLISYGFEEIPASHNIVDLYGYDASCYQDGMTDGRGCNICDYVEVPQEIIPAAHTNIDITAGYPATCTETGLTDGQFCYDCYTTVAEQTEIPRAGHNSKAVAGYAATCTSVGLSDGAVCADCGMVLTAQYNIISGGHKYGDDGKCQGCDLRVTTELTYRESSSLQRSVTGYIVTGIDASFNGSIIVIPSTYNDLPVIGIDDSAFANQTTVEKVVIPDTMQYVGSSVFSGCEALEIVECSDFAQMNEWATDWYGDANIKLTAVFNQGKTPFEVYNEAMNNTSHNYTNYTWTSTSNTYASSYPGLPAGYLVMSQSTVQKQSGNNFSYSQSETDYMSNTSASSSFYFVNNYFYQKYNDQWISIPMSFEYWCDTMAVNTASIKLQPEHFKNVTFYKDTDGKMYLELEMDAEQFTKLLEESSGTEFGVEILDPVYQYVFSADGYIESYGFTGSVGGVFEMVSESKFENINSTSFSAPYATAYSAPTCYSHSVIEVAEVAPTCFANGTSAFSYCSRCYQAISPMSYITASHHYENGECVDCGVFSDSNMSVGLAYTVNENSDGYVVVGIGACQDTTVYIPTHIYGYQITEVKADAFVNTNVEYIVINGYMYSISEFTGWRSNY